MYTREEAATVLADHVRWLDRNDRRSVADAIRTLLPELGAPEPTPARRWPHCGSPLHHYPCNCESAGGHGR